MKHLSSWSAWIGIFLVLIQLNPLMATEYFVDFEAGNDASSGTSPGTAWKRCPGDPNASGTALATLLNPGDRVRFKGGVVYRGSVILTRSGSDGNPIIYDGNSDNSWGIGKPILDGSDPITTPWTRCSSAGDARGNPNFANIYYTTVPSGVSNGWPQLLADGTTQTHTSQHPNPSNRFLFDVVSEWRAMAQSQITSTTLTDPAYFTQPQATYWSEAWVGIWATGNEAAFRPVTGFNPNTDAITFSAVTPYTDRASYYSMFNHPALIDEPGEHAVSVSENRIYLWPPDSGDMTGHSWTIGKRANAFAGSAKNNLVIKGFLIRGYFSTIGTAGYSGCAISLVPNTYDGTECRNNVFSDNEVRFIKNMDREWLITMNNGNGIQVLRNSVAYCFGGGMYGGGNSVNVSYNTFDFITGTAIYTPGAKNSLISHNTIQNLKGTHANGISVYSNADTVEISWNRIKNVPSLITYERSKNLKFLNNLVDANGEDQRINEWGGMTGYVHWIGNTLVNNSDNRILNVGISQANASYLLQNNIIDGGGNGSTVEIRSHNIYVGRNWWQTASYGWNLGGHEADHTEATLFTNPGSDWSLKPGSPAIDAGSSQAENVTPVDIHGIVRPQNGAMDIGAIETRTSVPPSAPKNVRLVP